MKVFQILSALGMVGAIKVKPGAPMDNMNNDQLEANFAGFMAKDTFNTMGGLVTGINGQDPEAIAQNAQRIIENMEGSGCCSMMREKAKAHDERSAARGGPPAHWTQNTSTHCKGPCVQAYGRHGFLWLKNRQPVYCAGRLCKDQPAYALTLIHH